MQLRPGAIPVGCGKDEGESEDDLPSGKRPSREVTRQPLVDAKTRKLFLVMTYLSNNEDKLLITIRDNILRWSDLPYVLREYFRASKSPVGMELKDVTAGWESFGPESFVPLHPMAPRVEGRVVNRMPEQVSLSPDSRKRRATNNDDIDYFSDDLASPPAKRSKATKAPVKRVPRKP